MEQYDIFEGHIFDASVIEKTVKGWSLMFLIVGN